MRRVTCSSKELHKIPEDVPVVGTLGELKELKGQREFVIAAAEVIRAVPDCRFVIVGVDNTVDKRFRRELKRLAGVSGLGEKILWLDWLDDTAGFYSAIDVFVSPSRSESFGLAILEAMAHGKAIVATETDGAKELIADCGVMVPVNEPVTLANEVSRLLDDRDEMVRIGLHAKQIASIEYSLDRMIDETEALYGRIIGGDPV
ncbi:glycosyltransferase family 4 protein [Leptolyngbya sp. 7M]|uniref:glycosyltransferase family 4 protein n=1 Tax=Leptolyngbya sp. 7M TaxID=2812896 RepID=UPI001B8B7DDB|nr:glycosyltransferase family 4 protein [Leptolyngbya sp. 7M]QYO67250.1 glycosyltransferase family 4 protein [Leptolyngbya sp. 7M]